jgi:hypothetical protein
MKCVDRHVIIGDHSSTLASTVFRWLVVREMLLSHIVGAALMVAATASAG